MKLVLATLAALGLATSFAFAGCAGHSAGKEQPDRITQAPDQTLPTGS
jgi:hypothetical protein